MQPVNLDHIRADASEADSRNRPIESAQAHMSRLRTSFYESLEQAGVQYPYLHPEVQDSAAAGRLRCLLGLKPYDGQASTVPKFLCPGGQTAWEWRGKIHQVLQRFSLAVSGEFVCGSAANFIAGRRLLVRGLTLLSLAHIVKPGQMHQELERRIHRLTYRYGDLDINIEVDGDPSRELRYALGALACPSEVTVQVKGPRHFLIVTIEDSKTGAALDFSVYRKTARDSPYLSLRDSLRVAIDQDPGAKSLLRYDCPNLWGYWRGQVLREAAREDGLRTDHYVLPKIIDLMTRKHCVSPALLEDICFSRWWTWVESEGSPADLFNRVKAVLDEHATSALGRQCYLLQWVRILKDHRVDKIGKFFTQLMRKELLPSTGMPFLHECMRLIKRGGLQLLELTGVIALQEAWKEPFSARLEQHNGRCHLRLRFRQGDTKRSLLLRYDPVASLAELESANLSDDELRGAMHLLWLKPITVRERGLGFAGDLGLSQQLSQGIRAHLLRLDHGLLLKDLELSQQQSLAALLVRELRGWKELSELGDRLLEERAGADSEREELCWTVAEKLLRDKAYTTCADFVTRVRNKGWERRGGYVDLLQEVLSKHPKAPLALLQSLLPIGIRLSEARISGSSIVRAADSPKVAATDFWELAQAFATAPAKVSADMLCRLHTVMPQRLWVAWVLERWKDDLEHPGLCRRVTELIVQCCEDQVALIFPSKHKSFTAFIGNRKRFVGTDEQCAALFERLLKAGLSLAGQEKLLRLWGLRDPRLWQRLVQAHLVKRRSQLAAELEQLGGQNSEEWAQWNAVLSLANQGYVETLLQGALKNKEPPGGREVFVASMLSRWSTVRVRPTILSLLMPGVDWLKLCKKQDAEHLLMRLLKGGQLLVGCFLLMQLRPDKSKHEFVYRALRDSLTEQPELLEAPIVLECVREYPEFIWQKGLCRCPATSLWPFVTELGLSEKQVSVTLLTELLNAALTADPTGRRALAIERKFAKAKHANCEYRQQRRNIAKLQLWDPSGDLHYAIEVYRQQGPDELCKGLPPEARLIRLLKLGCPEWVVDLLEAAPQTALAELSCDFYTYLLEKRLAGKHKMRARVLQHPPVRAEFLRAQWQLSCSEPQLSSSERGRMLLQHASYGARADLLSEMLGRHLELVRSQRSVCDAELANLVSTHLLSLPRKKALALWNALSQTQHPPIDKLFTALLGIAKQYEVPDSLVTWLLKHLNSSRSESFMASLTAGALQLNLKQLSEQVLPRLVDKQAWDILWLVLKKHPELSLPVPTQEMPQPPCLDQRISDCLRAKRLEESVRLAEHALCFKHPKAAGLASLLEKIQSTTQEGQLYVLLLCLALQPKLSASERSELVQRMGCPQASLSTLRQFDKVPGLHPGVKAFVDSLQICVTKSGMELVWQWDQLRAEPVPNAAEILAYVRKAWHFCGYHSTQLNSNARTRGGLDPTLIPELVDLIRRLPRAQRLAPATELVRLALAVLPSPKSFCAVRDLLSKDVDGDNVIGVLGYRYISESLAMMGEHYKLSSEDCTWLDYKGTRLFTERSGLPPGMWRYFAQAVLTHEVVQTRAKGAQTSLVRPRLGLGLWHGVTLERKGFDWVRSARMFIDDIYTGVQSHDIARVANWLGELLQHTGGRGSEKEITSLCRRVREPWLEGGPASFIRRHLATFLTLYPTIDDPQDKERMKTQRRVIIDGCHDVLGPYPQLVGELLDVVVDQAWFPHPDSQLTKELMALIIDKVKQSPQRHGTDEDLRALALLEFDTAMKLEERAPARLIAELGVDTGEGDQPKWEDRLEQLERAWLACAQQKAHRYHVQRLITLTVRHLIKERPSSQRTKGVASRIRALLIRARALRAGEKQIRSLALASVAYCAEFNFAAHRACLEEVFEGEQLAYHLGHLAAFVLVDPDCSMASIEALADIMPQFCQALARIKPDGFCGPMGLMHDEPIQQLARALGNVLRVYSNVPDRVADCRRCIDILCEVVLDTFMAPDRHLAVIKALLQVVDNELEQLCRRDASGQVLEQALNALQPLIVNETPLYAGDAEALELFCVLSAAEGTVARLSLFAEGGWMDSQLYGLLAGKELKKDHCFDYEKQVLFRLKRIQAKHHDYYESCLERIERCELADEQAFKALTLGAGQQRAYKAELARLDLLMAQGKGEEAFALWRSLRQMQSMDDWNSHWEQLFCCAKTKSVGLDALAQVCVYMPLSNEQLDRWSACAADIIPKIVSPRIRQDLIVGFLNHKRPIPTALLPDFCRLCRGDDLWSGKVRLTFLGERWKVYYPVMADRMLSQVGLMPITELWRGWQRFVYVGGDPDAQGLTMRLMRASTTFHMDSWKEARHKVVDWAYRERRTQVYGDLRFLWASFDRKRTIDHWEALVADTSASTRPVKVWDEVTVDDVAYLSSTHEKARSLCLRLLNDSRRQNWVSDAFCGKVLRRLAGFPSVGQDFFNEILELADDPMQHAEVEARLSALTNMLDQCLDDGPKAGLVLLANACRDSTAMLKHGWVYDRLIPCCTRLLNRQYSVYIHDEEIDEVLYSVSQVLVLRSLHFTRPDKTLRNCSSMMDWAWKGIKLAWNSFGASSHYLSREAFHAQQVLGGRVRVQPPAVTQRSRLLWSCLFEDVPSYMEKLFRNRVALMQLGSQGFGKLKQKEQIAVFEDLLPWVKELAAHKENDCVVSGLLWTMCQLVSLSEKHPRHQKRLAEDLWKQGCAFCGIESE